MIEVYTGPPGNGKSFALTWRAYKSMKRGKKVFSSYPIKGAYKLTFDDLVKYTFPENSTVIIDESGRWFNARKWSDLPDEVFDLFTLHRHLELDLICAVQDFNRMDKALREVVEITWWSRSYLFNPFFVYRGYYSVEQFGMKGQHDRIHYIFKWAKSRKLYDTHAMKELIKRDTIPEIPWYVEVENNKNIYNSIKNIYNIITKILKFNRVRGGKSGQAKDNDAAADVDQPQ